MYNMDDLMNFVEWLPDNVESFSDLSIEEVISKINEMSTSDEGKQILKQLTKQYKGMELFKKGGKLDYLLCLQKGGKVQDCGCSKKALGGETPEYNRDIQLSNIGKALGIPKAEDGTQLPRYAKIIETRSPYSAERTLYYSDTDGDYNIRDGRLISIEEGVPVAIGHNEVVRAGKPFGLNLPKMHEFRDPWYGIHVEHPDGLNLQSADWIDISKAKKETADKIKKIRKQK